MTTGFIAVIPARYGSTRLPGKPLKEIAGKPMIEWVYRQTVQSGASEVIVATDDERIVAACREFGAPVELTSTEHASGTDRIAELARRLAWADEQIVVNVQGDEPLISPLCIAQAARLLEWHPQAAIATLTAPLGSEAEFKDPDFVKVVSDRDGWALYFSRAPIPWHRDAFARSKEQLPPEAAFLRHIGLYAYRAGFLKRYASLPPSPAEQAESLEQLRILENGVRFKVVVTQYDYLGLSVDTAEDLEQVRAIIADREEK